VVVQFVLGAFPFVRSRYEKSRIPKLTTQRR
jgi:hypothetical protein